MLLVIIVAYLPKTKKVSLNCSGVVDFEPAMMELDNE
jgi:hypothetical protein